jgi:HK97 family phage portal protein
MGLALAAEEYSGRFFSQGAHPSGMLKYPAGAKITDPERIAAFFDNKYAGLVNKHRPFVATDGGEWQQISINANDAQLIESRQFSVVDICRFFGVPPVMIGETEKTTSWGSGVEQMARWFVMFTLNDHFTDIEQELETKLFRGDGFFAAFDERELTRGDTKTRADYYKAAIGGTQNPAWMTADEVRADEGLPPIGDQESTKLYRPADKASTNGGNADEKPASEAL